MAPSELPASVYGVCDGPSVQFRAAPVADGSDVVLFEFEAPERNDPNDCDFAPVYGEPTWISPDGTVLLHPVEPFEGEATPRSWVARGTDGAVVAFSGLPGRIRPVVWSPDSTLALVPQRPKRRPSPPEEQGDLPMHGQHAAFELLDVRSGSVTGGVPSSAGINHLQAWLPGNELIGELGGFETLRRSVDLATGTSDELSWDEYVRSDVTSPDLQRTIATGWNRFAVPEASDICAQLRQNDEGRYDLDSAYLTVEATSSCAVPALGIIDRSLVVVIHRPEIGESGVIGNDFVVLVDPATGDYADLSKAPPTRPSTA